MCGHIGVMGKKLFGTNDELMVEEGLYVCALRGMDSVGLGYIPVDENEAPYVTKRLGRPPVMVRMPGKGANVIIGHVRSATIGNRDSVELAHPFHFDNIIGAHNGTLRHDWRWTLEYETKEKFGSDSQGVFYNFAYRGVEETVAKLHGAWCFVWWDDDERTLNMLRNDERPLWTARGKSGNLYWASEYWMIQAMVRAGEKKRDEFVKGADGKLFSKVPVNQWLRFQLNPAGEVVELDAIPLEGAPPPPPPPPQEKKAPSAAGGKAGFVWAVWADGKWTEVPDGTKGAAKLSRSFADVSPSVTRLPQPKRKGAARMWREVAGVTYICARPGASEIPFDELIEFRTDGACLQCGTCISDPDQIGYLPNDYSYIACASCCRDWIEEEWSETDDAGMDQLKADNPELAAMIENLFPEGPPTEEDLNDDLPFTFGKPEDQPDADLAGLNQTLAEVIPPPVKAKPNKGEKPKRYAIFKKGEKREQYGTGCRSLADMQGYVRSLPNYEIRTIPITASDKKRLAIIIPVDEIVPAPKAPVTPPRTILSAPSKYAGGLGNGWAWWADGPKRDKPTCNS